MISYPKDSAGVDFDPAVHQTRKDGSPWVNKSGRYFVNALKVRTSKTLRRPSPRAGKPATSAEVQDPPQTSTDIQKTSAMELPPELRDIAPATPEEILGSELPAVTVQPDSEPAPAETVAAPVPGAEPPPPPPPVAEGSFVAPDAPGDGTPDWALTIHQPFFQDSEDRSQIF